MSPEPNDNQDQFNNRTNVSPSGSMDDQTTFQPITSTPTASPIVTPTPNPVPSTSELISEPVFNQPPQTITPNPFPAPSTSGPQSYASDTKPSGFSKFLKNKKLVIGIIVAILVVAIFGGSSYAYVSYYQNPQKVIADSLINAFTAKTSIYTGKVIYSASGVKVTVDITTETNGATGSLDSKVIVAANGKSYAVAGSALYDKTGDIYFKVNDLAGIIAEAKSGMDIPTNSDISIAIDKIVAKIDGTWIKISSEDIKKYSSETASSQTCLNDTINKFKDDKTAVNELSDAYSKNQFIIIDKDLGQKDGSFGYQVNSDNTKFKAFADQIKTTKVYKSLIDCDKTFEINTSDMDTTTDSNNDFPVKLWVDVWSHQITKIELNGNSNGSSLSAEIMPKYNQSVTITAPSKSITLTELQTYIEELTNSFNNSNDSIYL
jgi:hypothetical protein